MGAPPTPLHLLAIAHEAEVDFTMDDIDMFSRKTVLCKVARTHLNIIYTGREQSPEVYWDFGENWQIVPQPSEGDSYGAVLKTGATMKLQQFLPWGG